MGCLTKCILEQNGHLQAGDSVQEGYETKLKNDFERATNLMQQNLDRGLSGIQKCAQEFEGLDYDDCAYAYQMERCVHKHGVFV